MRRISRSASSRRESSSCALLEHAVGAIDVVLFLQADAEVVVGARAVRRQLHRLVEQPLGVGVAGLAGADARPRQIGQVLALLRVELDRLLELADGAEEVVLLEQHLAATEAPSRPRACFIALACASASSSRGLPSDALVLVAARVVEQRAVGLGDATEDLLDVGAQHLEPHRDQPVGMVALGRVEVGLLDLVLASPSAGCSSTSNRFCVSTTFALATSCLRTLSTSGAWPSPVTPGGVGTGRRCEEACGGDGNLKAPEPDSTTPGWRPLVS